MYLRESGLSKTGLLPFGCAQLGILPDVLETVSLGFELVALLWRAARFAGLSRAGRKQRRSGRSADSDGGTAAQHAVAGR